MIMKIKRDEKEKEFFLTKKIIVLYFNLNGLKVKKKIFFFRRRKKKLRKKK